MSALSTSSILANLSPTLFQAGPQDIVATPDIYTLNSGSLNSTQTINTTVDRFNPFAGSIVNNLLSGASGILSAVTSTIGLTQALNNPMSLVNAATVGRLASVVGFPITSLSPVLQSTLSAAINLNASNFNSLDVFNSGSNITSAIQTGDIEGATNVLSMASAMSGNASFTQVTDVGARSTMASTVITALIGLGLATTVGDFITTQDAPIARHALSQNVQTALMNSDLMTVQLCITQLGVGGVLSQVPDAALQLLKYYRLPAGTASTAYATAWQALLAILVQLAPSWNTTLRSGVSYETLTYFQVASKDAITVMKTDSDLTTVMGAAIAGTFHRENTLSTLKQMYPHMLVM